MTHKIAADLSSVRFFAAIHGAEFRLYGGFGFWRMVPPDPAGRVVFALSLGFFPVYKIVACLLSRLCSWRIDFEKLLWTKVHYASRSGELVHKVRSQGVERNVLRKPTMWICLGLACVLP